MKRSTCVPCFATALVALAGSGCGDAAGNRDRAEGSSAIGHARLAADGTEGDVVRVSVPPRHDAAGGKPPARSSAPRAAVGTEAPRCGAGGLEPTGENLDQIAGATLCLLNAERQTRGLRALQRNARLGRAAVGHSRDMVRRSYFAHDSRSGATFVDRIKRAGYKRGPRGSVLGENLAWGGGLESTARQIVDAWMQSPPHRANILRARFQEIGIGIALGAPVTSSPRPAATYTANFGGGRRTR